jgi:quercetin dioxygenase-like cupin family protein
MVHATAAHTGGALGVVETVIPAGHSAPLHVHRHEDEAFYVFDGALELQRGEERIHAEAGAFVFLPRGVPHTFLGVGPEPARVLVLLVPGGLERAFAEPSRFQEILAESGVETVGPPLA